jgi:hypothetical protein
MRRSDFSVQLDRRKPPCVLDAALLLAYAPGPSMALRLATVFEPWLTRSFWQTLDASELLLMHSAEDASAISGTALARWLTLRENTDIGSWVLRWVGDSLAESQLLDAVDLAVVDRYEALAEGLQRRADLADLADLAEPKDATCPAWRGFDMHRSATDALALSATMEGALVLCAAPHDALPPPVQAAHRLGLRLQALADPPPQSLFLAERQFLREALASAGLAVMTQSLPPLAAVHVWLDEDAPLPAEASLGDALPDPWAAASVWWYWL